MLLRANMPKATEYYGSEDAWKQVCEQPDIDLIYIATDWLHHTPHDGLCHGTRKTCSMRSTCSHEHGRDMENDRHS